MSPKPDYIIEPDLYITACCRNRKSAFGEMSRQARHDSFLSNSDLRTLSSRAKSRDLSLSNTPLRIGLMTPTATRR